MLIVSFEVSLVFLKTSFIPLKMSLFVSGRGHQKSVYYIERLLKQASNTRSRHISRQTKRKALLMKFISREDNSCGNLHPGITVVSILQCYKFYNRH